MNTAEKPIVIAIDGFSSCGKSSFAKKIAREYNFLYVDSGAMYRAVTLWAMENNAIRDGQLDEKKIISNLDKIHIEFRYEESSTKARLFLNGKDAEDAIRSLEVSALVSPVSKISELRSQLVQMQREYAADKSVVMDGRDIGTVVFPDADIKIFMSASPEIRAERRYKELQEKGEKLDFMDILKNVNERDRIDQNREIGPLRQALDAVVLDNSHMSQDEQMIWFRERFNDILN